MEQLVQLLSGTGEVVEGRICTMQLRHWKDFQSLWQDILILTEQPDAAWMWDYKLRQAEQEARYEAYALEVEAVAQGLIFLETQWHRSHLPQRYPLVYVEAIASAPWNRTTLEHPPYLKRVGRLLLLFARERSLALGYEGRVGLHSLPEAEGFYRHFQMPDHGPDPEKEDLVYFEYGVTQQ
ncbi:MAG: hypothetical protein AAFX01_13945 [Cyanobacteria bacterium J06638_28]